VKDAPLSSGECVRQISGLFVAPHWADDAVGELAFVGSLIHPGSCAGCGAPWVSRGVVAGFCCHELEEASWHRGDIRRSFGGV